MTTPSELKRLLDAATPGPWEFWSVHRSSHGDEPGVIVVHHDEEPSQFPIWRVAWIDENGHRVHTPVADACVVGGEHPTSEHFAQAKANAALIVAAVNALPALISAAQKAERLEAFAQFAARHCHPCRRDTITAEEFRSIIEGHPTVTDINGPSRTALAGGE